MQSKTPTLQVFISHVRKDRRIADAVASELKIRGFSVWEMKHAPSGKRWKTQLDSALEGCDLMVALLTRHSYSSPYVRDELEYALFTERFKDRLLPVFIASSVENEFSRVPWVLGSIRHLKFDEYTPPQVIARRVVDEVATILNDTRSP
jgi:hypothetical protein